LRMLVEKSRWAKQQVYIVRAQTVALAVAGRVKVITCLAGLLLLLANKRLVLSPAQIS
jgi:hypothetical protein